MKNTTTLARSATASKSPVIPSGDLRGPEGGRLDFAGDVGDCKSESWRFHRVRLHGPRVSEGKGKPELRKHLQCLHLNIKTEQDVRWLQMDRYDASDGVIDEAALQGKPCWAGLDLSTTTDLSAFAMVFPDNEGGYDVLCRFWVPAENAKQREHRDRVPYSFWIRQGWIKETSGDVIDYDVIRADIGELGKCFDIREIAADRWNATQIITQLAGDGFNIFAFGQGFRDMAAPTKELEKLVISGKLRANKNPVLRWMASNVSVEQDAAGNVKPSKKKSSERIDGVVATIMGLARASLQSNEFQSVYETRGLLSV